MFQSIYSNSNSYFAVKHINQAYTNLYSSMQKLSSGMKLNSAKDGPAQLMISEMLRSRITDLNQMIENNQMQIGKLQTGSSYLVEFRLQLTELRSLAVGAANEGFNSEAVQKAYSESADYVISSYNLNLAKAEYNGAVLFDGSSGSIADLTDITGIDLTTSKNAEASIKTIDKFIESVDHAIIETGSIQANRLEPEIASMRISRENLIAAESNMRNTDIVLEFSKFIVEQFKAKTSLAMLSHNLMKAQTVLDIFK